MNIHKCSQCCLLWTNPIFQFPNLYESLYEGEGLTTDYNKAIEIRNSNTYFDKDYDHIFKILKTYNPDALTLLEFGSSWGYFLYQANANGFDSTGIEVSSKRANIGRNILGANIVDSLDLLLQDDNNTYDFIVTLHTLEHLESITNIFDQFYKLLKKEGTLLIEVPNIDLSKTPQVFQYLGAVHPLGFTEDFFVKNLPNHGFKCTVYRGYEELFGNNSSPNIDKGDNLIAVCRKY